MSRAHRRIVTIIVVSILCLWLCAVMWVGIEYTRSSAQGRQTLELELTDIYATASAR